jgi:Na+-driven multidrug efflux pump
MEVCFEIEKEGLLMAIAAHASKGRKHDVDMTQGNIIMHLITFALPLLLGNLFQQLYNMVDTWVLGNFASTEAYSAVGTVTPVCNMLIGFFMGLSAGAGVVISQHYGAGQHEKVQQAVHTAIAMTLCLGVLFTAIGICMTPHVLKLMNMDAAMNKEATTYLTIYFSGIMGLIISYFTNVATGPTIVIIASIIYFATYFYGRKTNE